jgi:hypothetical protein
MSWALTVMILLGVRRPQIGFELALEAPLPPWPPPRLASELARDDGKHRGRVFARSW